MSIGCNSTALTSKCNCKNPQWSIEATGVVKSGKSFGKQYIIVYCANCRKQWKTFALNKIMIEIDKQIIKNKNEIL